MRNENQAFILADGRTLGYAEYGNSDGKPTPPMGGSLIYKQMTGKSHIPLKLYRIRIQRVYTHKLMTE